MLQIYEALSGISGSVSLACWLFVLAPQLLVNYTSKSADGISLAFLIVWLVALPKQILETRLATQSALRERSCADSESILGSSVISPICLEQSLRICYLPWLYVYFNACTNKTLFPSRKIRFGGNSFA